MSNNYPFLKKVSEVFKVSQENLIQAFKLEKDFHYRILSENDVNKRLELYADIYAKVHPLYHNDKNEKIIINNKFSNFFKKELTDKSILDVGCGNGRILMGISKYLKTKELVGLDVSPVIAENISNITFIKKNVVEFKMDNSFDVVLSNHVLEHIAPLDLKSHVSSIFNVLNNNGVFIINMPNRLFGPHDVTRIIDFTYSNKTSAQGTHINEMTYSEVVDLLKNHGFKSFYTYLPLVPLRSVYDKFPKVRIPVSFFIFIERSKILMNILYKLKYDSRCIAKFDILLVARK